MWAARGGDVGYNEGSKVEANYRGRGKFYPGRVKRDRGDGTYDIEYDDGERETRLPSDGIRKVEIGHADVAQLLLSAGANIETADKVILMIHDCMAV